MAQREKLTEKLVRAAEPRAGIYQVFDEDVRGFSLRVFTSGSRNFTLDYRVKGHQRRFAIGRWPEWTVTAAREQAKALRRIVDDGGDPLGERETGMTDPGTSRQPRGFAKGAGPSIRRGNLHHHSEVCP